MTTISIDLAKLSLEQRFAVAFHAMGQFDLGDIEAAYDADLVPRNEIRARLPEIIADACIWQSFRCLLPHMIVNSDFCSDVIIAFDKPGVSPARLREFLAWIQGSSYREEICPANHRNYISIPMCELLMDHKLKCAYWVAQSLDTYGPNPVFNEKIVRRLCAEYPNDKWGISVRTPGIPVDLWKVLDNHTMFSSDQSGQLNPLIDWRHRNNPGWWLSDASQRFRQYTLAMMVAEKNDLLRLKPDSQSVFWQIITQLPMELCTLITQHLFRIEPTKPLRPLLCPQERVFYALQWYELDQQA